MLLTFSISSAVRLLSPLILLKPVALKPEGVSSEVFVKVLEKQTYLFVGHCF